MQKAAQHQPGRWWIPDLAWWVGSPVPLSCSNSLRYSRTRCPYTFPFSYIQTDRRRAATCKKRHTKEQSSGVPEKISSKLCNNDCHDSGAENWQSVVLTECAVMLASVKMQRIRVKRPPFDPPQ